MWRPRGLANNIPLRRWIPGRCPSPRHPRNDPATSVPLRHTPSRKKSRWGIQTEKLKAAAEINDKKTSGKNRKSHLILYINIILQKATCFHLQTLKGASNMVVTEVLGYQKSHYQTYTKKKTSGSASGQRGQLIQLVIWCIESSQSSWSHMKGVS